MSDIEWEATFENINPQDIREKLRCAGATLVKKNFMQKRVTLNLPKGNEVEGGWLRIRDEGDRITMSYKVVSGNKIEDQKEIQLIINDFKTAEKFLEEIGCIKKAYQESKREIWKIGEVEICIDEWPFLEPYVEIEGPNEESVKEVAKKIGLEYNKALFCSVDTVYSKKYAISEEYICNEIKRICFDEENPFKEK
jgi:adenylate cyclase, class 2